MQALITGYVQCIYKHDLIAQTFFKPLFKETYYKLDIMKQNPTGLLCLLFVCFDNLVLTISHTCIETKFFRKYFVQRGSERD